MKCLIIDKLESEYMTNIKDVFYAIGNKQRNYNWLISDYICNHYPSDKIKIHEKYVWISGDSITEIVNKNDIQFIWGALSGFDKNVFLNDILQYELPYADGNRELWIPNVRVRNPLAKIEIVAWNSNSLIVISELEDIIDIQKLLI